MPGNDDEGLFHEASLSKRNERFLVRRIEHAVLVDAVLMLNDLNERRRSSSGSVSRVPRVSGMARTFPTGHIASALFELARDTSVRQFRTKQFAKRPLIVKLPFSSWKPDPLQKGWRYLKSLRMGAGHFGVSTVLMRGL